MAKDLSFDDFLREQDGAAISFDDFMQESSKPVEGGFTASVKQTVGSTIKGAGQLAADYIPGVGEDNAVKRYGEEVIAANPTAVRSLEDIKDKPWTAVKEATGNAGASVAGVVGARALGMGITAASPLAGPAAPAVALAGQAIAWFGPAAIAALPSYGSIREKQQINDPEANDSWKAKAIASLGAATVGAIETKFGPQEWALSALTKEGRKALAEKFAETTVAKAIGFGALKGAAIEGAEELAQNPIEQLAGYDNPTTPESLKDTAFSGAMGALGGGVFGGGTGAMAGRGQNKVTPPSQPKPDVQDIGAAQNVDEAIAAADAVIGQSTQDALAATRAEKQRANLEAAATAETDRQAKEGDLQAFMESENRNLQVARAQILEESRKARELEQIQQAGRQDLGRTPDQQVAAAAAATDEAPTAMQLAMQRALQRQAQEQANVSPATPVQTLPAESAGRGGVDASPGVAADVGFGTVSDGAMEPGRAADQPTRTAVSPQRGTVAPELTATQPTAGTPQNVQVQTPFSNQAAAPARTAATAEQATAVPPAGGTAANLEAVGVAEPQRDGTALIRGDVQKILTELKRQGFTAVLKRQGGVLVGRSQAQRALEVFKAPAQKVEQQAQPKPTELPAEPAMGERRLGAIREPSGKWVAVDDAGKPIPESPKFDTGPAADNWRRAAKQAAPEVKGEPIDSEWSKFTPESGTRGVPRADMPQIKAEHRGAMTNFLNARGIAHEQVEVPASDLKPTQAEFSPAKVEKAKAFEGGDRSILISADGHILDGHHQWLAKRDAGETVQAIRLDAPIDKLLDEVKEFPSAQTAEGATEPAAQQPEKPTTPKEKPAAQPEAAPAEEKPISQMSADDLLRAAADKMEGRAEEKIEPTNSLSRTASWVIKNKETGDVVMETFDKKKVDALNTKKYEAVPIQEHLASLSEKPPKAEPQEPMFSRAAPVWRSALRDGVATIPAKAQSADGWRAQIQGLVNKGAVKADEVEWSGVTDWLQLQTGKVTKEQMLDFLDANGVQVEEVTLGGKNAIPEALMRPLRELTPADPTGFRATEWMAYSTRFEGIANRMTREGDAKGAERMWEASRLAEYEAEKLETDLGNQHGSTKYSQYTLPGGENYREVLLTLPVRGGEQYTRANIETLDPSSPVATRPDVFWYFKVPGNVLQIPKSKYPSQVDARDYIIREKQPAPPADQNYRSSHWDAPNVLAHIRMNDRTDADGKRVLFVEEIQSDWGQAGKKNGFIGRLSPEAEEMRKIDAIPEDKLTDEQRARARELLKILRARGERDKIHDSVPAAPFVTKTDAWLNLAIKRVITMAAQEGYDRVAFINGEQSADRYDLSKQVESIDWKDLGTGGKFTTIKTNDGQYVEFKAKPDGTVAEARGSGGTQFNGQPLDAVVGKDIAAKIMEADSGKLSGLDLKVGGEGMKAFYDQIVPNAAKALLKKLGGGELQTVEIAQTGEAAESWRKNWPDQPLKTLEQPGFNITPAMREKAAQGLPMFARAEEGQLPAVITPSTVQRVQAAVAELLGGKQLSNSLGRIVATTAAEIKSTWEPLIGKNVQIGSEGEAGVAQAFFEPSTKTVFMIADHINVGAETAVLAHELMHKHGQSVLGKAGWDRLHGMIGTWKDAAEDSDERFVYDYATRKVQAVGEELSTQELFPYAVEAAIRMGIKPSMQAKRGTVANWLESVRQNLKVVWDKITGKAETFKAQDMVDLAFGIAQMENPQSAKELSGALTGEQSPELFDLRSKWEDRGLKIDIYEQRNGDLNLSRIVVPKDGRNAGLGTAAMRDIIGYADKNNKRVVLSPSADFGGNKVRLVEFYKRLGFVENKGPNKDLEISESMYRVPAESSKVQYSRSLVTGKVLPQTWQAPDPTKLDDFIYTLQDKHVDTKRVVKAVRDAIGAISDHQDPYLQEELFHGRAAMATKEFLEKQLRPLLEDMKMRGVEMSDFEEYLHNRHAERRNVQVAKINPNMPDGGSGIKTTDARAYLAGLTADKRRAYQALAQRVDQINRDTRDLLVSSGLEKQSTIDAWEQAYGDEYVPLMREEMDNGMGIGQGFSVRGSSSKRAMGSDKPVANIMANIALQREKAITRSNKRRIGEAVYGLVLSAPNPDFWFAVDPALQQDSNQITATALQLISMGMAPADADSIAREPTQRYVNPATGLVEERINPAIRSADNVLAVRIDGEDKYVFFNAKDERAMRMATSLKNLDADQLGTVMGTVAKMTRYFSAVNTQYNPIFGVTNITRDVQTALLNLNSTPLRSHKAEVMKHILPALRGIYIDLRDHRAGKQPTSSYAQIFEEFQREGGATGYRDMYANAAERAEALQSEIDDIGAGKLKQAGKAIFGWLSDYNESMENAVRVAAYKVGVDQGMTKQQAASLAKNLTVNFNRKGRVALQAGALYAFFNASVQGSARMAETLFSGGKLSEVGKKIVTGGLLLGAMQALLLAAAGYDDDEPPDFVRERNLLIPTGGGKYISIPMPLGFHVLPNISRISTEWAMSGFKNTPKRIGQLIGLFADAFNPIGSSGLSIQTITPTIIDPFAALSENKDFTGRQIAKKDFDPMHPTAGHTRAKDTATPWARFISKAVNYATGGTEYSPGLASPTPDQIDYLIGQATGGVGREAGKIAQVASGTITGEEVPLHKIPLVGRFIGTTEGQSAEASRFYNNLRKIGEHKVELDGLRRDKKSAQATTYLREHRDAMLVPVATKMQREVSQLNQRKRDLIKNGASQDRVKMIDSQITLRMRQFNQRVDRVNDRN